MQNAIYSFFGGIYFDTTFLTHNYKWQKVKSVAAGSKAEDAGLKEMDLITHIRKESVQVFYRSKLTCFVIPKMWSLC